MKSGKNAGAIHTPHKYDDGTFVVSKTRYEKDYIHVASLVEVSAYLDKGYRVRVSNPTTRKSPSLVLKESVLVVKP